MAGLWPQFFLLLVSLACLVNSVPLCEDKTESCKKWAYRKDLCNENNKYKKQRFYVAMSRLCKKSCEMCGDDDLDLFDTDARCNSYSGKGYCDMRPHQGFMLKRCKFSCRRTIRNGITSPGRGNFQRKNPPAEQQQQQGNWNQHYQSDNKYPQQYAQQYPQQYAQQYGQQYGQQSAQQTTNAQQQNTQQNGAQQQSTQQNGAQSQSTPQNGAQSQSTQQNGAQSQNTQQNYAQPQNGQQNDAQTPQQSLSSMPVQVQALTQPQVQAATGGTRSSSRKQKVEGKADVKS